MTTLTELSHKLLAALLPQARQLKCVRHSCYQAQGHKRIPASVPVAAVLSADGFAGVTCWTACAALARQALSEWWAPTGSDPSRH